MFGGSELSDLPIDAAASPRGGEASATWKHGEYAIPGPKTVILWQRTYCGSER